MWEMLVEKFQVGNLVMKESDYVVNLDRHCDPNDKYAYELDRSGSGWIAFKEYCKNGKKNFGS
jgi:hypothetical protein